MSVFSLSRSKKVPKLGKCPGKFLIFPM